MIVKKVTKQIKEIAVKFKTDRRFGICPAVYGLAATVFNIYRLRSAGSRMQQKQEDWIKKYLRNLLAPVIEDFRHKEAISKENQGCGTIAAPVWTCWWQGEEKAPLLVQKCIRSIRRNAGEHPVHVITGNNYLEYLEIPDYILSKVQSGQMCIANFSDYLRISLIAKLGGIWLNSTIFCYGENSGRVF